MNRMLRSSASLVMVLLVLLQAACVPPVKWVSDYDEQTDQALSVLQRRMEGYFQEYLANPDEVAVDFDSYQGFFQQVDVDLSAIKFRVDARPLNDITSEQLQILERIINNLELLHQSGLADVQAVEQARLTVNSSLSSILQLELAKKRGEN